MTLAHVNYIHRRMTSALSPACFIHSYLVA